MSIRYLSGLSVDSTVLVVDTANDRVGIGTASPSTALDVVGTITAYRYQAISSSASLVGYGVGTGLGMFNAGTDILGFATASTERMRITSDGNVGIGTTSPGAVLHISRGVNNLPTVFRIENVDTTIETAQEVNSIEFYTNDGSASGTGITSKIVQIAENPGNQYGLSIYSYNLALVEAVRISNNGNVGIGTTGPTAKLEVAADVAKGILINRTFTTSSQTLANVRAYYGLAITPLRGGTGGLYFTNYDADTPIIQSVNSSDVAQSLLLNPLGGNVGIGTTAPFSKLTVSGALTSSASQISIVNTEGGHAIIRSGIAGVSNNGISFITAAVDGTSQVNNMVIDAAGEVGIGTTQPMGPLEVYKSTTGGLGGHIILNNNGLAVGNETAILFGDSGVGSASGIRAAISSTVEGAPYRGDIKFKTGVTTYGGLSTSMIITGAGNVGIGTTSPGAKLQIGNGTSNSPSSVAVLSSDGGNAVLNALSLVNSRAAANGNGTSINFHNANNYGATGRIVNVLDSGTNASLRFSVYNSTDDALVERITLLSSGNVGIGTTAPVSILHIEQIQNAESLITLRNNRQDAGNVPIFGISAQNSTTDVARISFYRGTGGLSGYLTFSTKFDNDSSLTERVRIDGSGNVGIGTTAPGTPLGGAIGLVIDGNATSDVQIRLQNNSTGRTSADGGLLSISGTAMYLWNYENDALLFGTNNTERMRILAGGNVGIGTTSPGRKLTVQGADDGTMQLRLMGTASQNSYWEIGREAQSTGQFRFIASRNGSVITPMVIDDQTGNVGIGTTSPATKLDVSGGVTSSGSANPYFALNNGTAVSYLQVASGALNVRVGGANPITFTTDASELMRITSAGNVGIGVASPNEKLHVGGNINAYINGGIDAGLFASTSAGSTTIALRSNGITHFNGGNVGIGTTGPNAKLNVVGGTGEVIRLESSPVDAASGNGPALAFQLTQSNGQSAQLGLIKANADANWGGFLTFNTKENNATPNNTTVERMRITSGGNVLIGTTTDNGYKLNVNGSGYFNGTGYFENRVQTNNSFSDANNVRVLKPLGGSRNSSTPTETGAIKITYPVGYTNTMHRVKLNIYNYASNQAYTVYFGGYNYGPGPYWTNVFAYTIGPSSTDFNPTVRFGYDGTKMVVYVGELNTSWSYPQFFIEEVETGFNLASQFATDAWSIGLEASAFQNVTDSVSNTQATNWARSGSSAYYGFGNVGIGTTAPAQKFEVSGGAIIASGFGNRAAGTGKALEIGMDGTNAVLQAFDRTASAFIPISINSSAATFSSSVQSIGLLTTGNNGATTGQFIIESGANASSRRWKLLTSQNVNGDFVIQQSTTQTGSTFADILAFNATGAATFSSSVAATSAAFSGDVSVNSTNSKTGGTAWNLNVRDNTTMAANVGGGISFQGLYTTGGGVGNFGAISAYKTNATSGNESGGLRLYYSANGIITQGLQISETGAATFSSSVTASSLIKSGGTAAQYLMADGSVSTLTNPVTGTGTTNYVPKFTSASAIGNSNIYDDGTKVGIQTSTPITRLNLGTYTGSRLPYINGTVNTFDANGITVTSSNTANAAIGGGIDLTNNVHSVGSFSPLISFSALSQSGTYNNNYAAIYGVLAGDSGDGNWNSGHLVFATALAFGASEKMRITNAGNVGIGTAAPATKLRVQSSGSTFTTPDNNDVATISIYNSNNSSATAHAIISMRTQVSGGSPFISFDVENEAGYSVGMDNASNQFRIAYGWNSLTTYPGLVLTPAALPNVLIGTTTDNGYKLRVNGKGYFDNNVVITPISESWAEGLSFVMPTTGTWGGLRWRRERVNNDGNWYVGYTALDNGDDLVFGANNGGSQVDNIIRLTKAGNVGIGTTAPATKLDVSGTLGFTVGAAAGIIRRTTVNGSNGIVIQGNANDTVSDTNAGASIFVGGGTLTDTYEGNIDFTAYGAIVDANRNQIRFFNRSGVNTVAERMRINHLGNVGIGTANPAYKLDVSSDIRIGEGLRMSPNAGSLYAVDGALSYYSSTNGVYLNGAGTNGWLRLNGSGVENDSNCINIYGAGAGGYIELRTGAATRIHILNGGNVGIGTTGPTEKLHVDGSTLITYNNSFQSTNSVGNKAILARVSPTSGIINYAEYATATNLNGFVIGSDDARVKGNITGDSLEFITNTSTRMTVLSSGNVGINTTVPGSTLHVVGDVLIQTGSLGVGVNPNATDGRIDASNDIVAFSTSDRRLKENITPIANALEKVRSLTGVEFDWKEETKSVHGYEGHDVGVIAQDVQAVLPEAVRTNDSGYLSVRYEKMIALLVEAMKEQQAQIDELKAQINDSSR